MQDIKGYYFTLLDDDEGDKVVPILEKLLAVRKNERKNKQSTEEMNISVLVQY